jgi:tetratricopeptide (TPR) repeat protein
VIDAAEGLIEESPAWNCSTAQNDSTRRTSRSRSCVLNNSTTLTHASLVSSARTRQHERKRLPSFVARARARLIAGDLVAAEAEVDEALALEPRSLIGRELKATVALFRGQRQLGRQPNVDELRQAAQTYLDLCATLTRLGRRSEAARILARAVEASFTLRRDPANPTDVRAKAYFLSAKEAHDAGGVAEAEALAAAWMELEPKEGKPAWVRLESLLLLGRADEAVSVADAAGLEPDDVGEAQLLAHIYLRGLPPAEALRRIIELSDRFDRQDEKLEGMVVAAWTQAGSSAAPEDGARGALSLNEFPERFPGNRGAVRAVALEELNEILRQQAAAVAELDALGGEVIAGRLPVVSWALAASMSTVGMWSGLQFLPIAFADPKLREADVEGAAAAVGRRAVWDASSLVTIAVLDETHRRRDTAGAPAFGGWTVGDAGRRLRGDRCG